MNKPRLLFVYYHKKPDYWMDGLYAALELLQEDFNIQKLNLALYDNESTKGQFDFILAWGAFNSPAEQYVRVSNRKAKKGLCIAGNAFMASGADTFDVLFYETKWYRPEIQWHRNIVHAFGINSQIFNQNPLPLVNDMKWATPAIWDYIGVGAFASWKRWEKMKDKKGMKLVIGEYQLGNEVESMQITNNLLKSGVMVSNMVHPVDLANFYHWSRILYMPADINGGGERSVLESKACGLQVEIEPDNPKLKEILEGPVYDEVYYAKQLKEGIMSCL